MEKSEPTYDGIVRIVYSWPIHQRFALVQDVLKTLEPQGQSNRPRKDTLRQALGLLATAQPAPSDFDIEQWLDEHRSEKYG